MSVEARNGAGARTGGAGEHADRVKRPDEPLISIIIPTLDEARVIAVLLAQLEPLRSGCEIVFVDGGSSDGTREAILEAGFRLVDAPRGRGTQLNAGARASSGEILFFLHADSALPPDPLGEIRRAMRGRRVGCFGVRFEPSSPLMLCCRFLSNFRCYVRRIMFGDQGIFIDRDLFFEVGGFPDLPLMEDYELSLRMKRQHIPLVVLDSTIITSGRRYQRRFPLLTMGKMFWLRCLYRLGVDSQKIADMYRDIR